MQNSSKFIQIPSLDDLDVFLNDGKDAQSTRDQNIHKGAHQLNIDLGFANLEIQLSRVFVNSLDHFAIEIAMISSTAVLFVVRFPHRSFHAALVRGTPGTWRRMSKVRRGHSIPVYFHDMSILFPI